MLGRLRHERRARRSCQDMPVEIAMHGYRMHPFAITSDHLPRVYGQAVQICQRQEIRRRQIADGGSFSCSTDLRGSHHSGVIDGPWLCYGGYGRRRGFVDYFAFFSTVISCRFPTVDYAAGAYAYSISSLSATAGLNTDRMVPNANVATTTAQVDGHRRFP